MLDLGPVLVVDDDAAVRAALKFALELEGFRVRLYDGPAALLAERSLPERGCLVVDFRMPDMDGIALIGVLRSRHIALPAIVISGQVDKVLLRRANQLGVSRVLEKPLSDATLVECIRRALEAPPT
ncbi:MAG: response regulator transcription factor [Reyranella sp.]|uniref:response regulator transcription factor n=1 Tax=Reyranella sp. TaxID=1929291 RepID=UPI003D10781A